jgi:hypothetical protein
MTESIGKDVLNPLLVSIASSDLFFQLGRFEYGSYEYRKDRAYRFEQQIIKNTNGALDHTLGSYRAAELSADIPMIFLYPTIINDGRKMLVSSLDMGFMTELPSVADEEISYQHELVEYRSLLADAGADSTRYLSLVRANATFPYILPQVTLPTTPPIQLMDAGIRDNFGFTLTYRYMATMRAWIQENTSGVIVLQVRDKGKDIADLKNSQSLLSRLTSPLGNVYGNFMKAQDFNNDELYSSAKTWLQVPLHYVDLQMEQVGTQYVSMSWHLTALEKKTVQASVSNSKNQSSLEELMILLGYR